MATHLNNMPQRRKDKQAQSTKHSKAACSSYQALVLSLLQTSPTRAYTLSKLYKHFKRKFSKETVKEAVLELAQRGAIEKLNRGRFTIPYNPVYVIGKVDYVHPSYAYIVTDDGKDDVWIRQADLLFALDKDLVRVMITQQKGPKRHPVGKVVEIIKRSKTTWVGRVVKNGQAAFVIPYSRRMHYDIFVRPEDLRGAKHNDKVIVALTAGPTAHKNPEGRIKQVLGQAGMHEVEMHAIMAEFDLPTCFSTQVLAEVKDIPAAIPARESSRRSDFRKVDTFTIDPTDAQDFDDALSLKKLPNGHYEVGIHIADVGFYVQEGSLVDQEAFERGTSVYLVDRTIPMLPERLSNELCSLKPHEDRLTFSVVFELDARGKLHKEWFGETIMHSDRRFTYEEAQQAITQQQGDFYQELTILNELAKQLRAERFRQGAVNFETAEVKFQLDEHGKPLSVLPKVSQDTHRLVEEFMLLANRRVALHVRRMKQGKEFPTFVYRTHDEPDLEKLNDFALFVKQFGYSIKTSPKAVTQSINTLSAAIAGKPEANIIQSLAIRMMAKALYTTEAKPHFGLAFQHYTHFTSPIRRYPDLIVHRLLKQYLQGQFKFDQQIYEKKCQHASERERVAAEAERASIKYKQVELMQTLQGEFMEGVISSIMDWGIYIELVDSLCEGMVRFADMTDDYYVLDEKGFKAIGQRTKKAYHLGDLVKVRVQACDISKRTINLLLVA
ncbi:MAG: ribonuclease R [Bacteroidota bacterium]